ncbi:MFS transporter [Geodermatophilus sabuli]|uniref:Fucose permease n=1 Tax=Geodermatophilus sabuli TaxID=1564158 RepID=A0A285EB17_9ACTN|nr:MFS transporter [Geodermatophilus sabuli]MBB3085395.1 MFS family permease [Geodermatophilus sabuli]SNX96177.1 Fucose permease [Geodermatophilus sabuli]
MSVTLATVDAARLRRARTAVATCFFLNAVFYASLVPRLPEVKAQLGLSSTALGAALAAAPLGALLAGLSSAALMRRFGSGRVASSGLVLLGITVWTVSVAPNWLGLAAALLVMGALDAVIDVAQNAHGLRVQRLYQRSILNAFHGVWSIGAVAGGLLGSAAAGLDVPLVAQLTGTAVVFGAVALVVSRALLPGPDEPESTAGTAPRERPRRRAAIPALAVLGVLAVCGAVVEDAGSSWSALYLRTELDAGAATAGLGFVALSVAMTVGRLTGDRVVDRFGQRRVARAGGALAAVGTGLALALPSIPTTLAGFALAGLGVATLVPAVYHAADELPGLPHGLGLTVINWLLRIGFLLSPPLVGALADAFDLRVALVTVMLAGIGTLVLGRALRGRPVAARPGA